MQSFVHSKMMLTQKYTYHRFAAALPRDLVAIFDDTLEQPGPSAWPSDGHMDDRQDAAYTFTSGTTAQPRLVRITHRNIQANTASIIEYLGLTADERMMAILPFHYCFGTSLLAHPLARRRHTCAVKQLRVP